MTLALRLDRWIAAPPDRVFAALTDIEQLRQWYTCDPESVWTFHRWDAEVGGTLHVTIGAQDFEVEVTGVFHEVIEPSRLSYDWNDEHIRLDLSPAESGTTIELTHTRLPTENDRTIRHDGCRSKQPPHRCRLRFS